MRTATQCQRLLEQREAQREALLVQLEALDAEIQQLREEVVSAPRRGKGVRIPAEQARDAIVTLKEFSIPELADFLGCSPPAAKKFVDQFEKRGIVEFDRMRQAGVGRPAKVFRYVPAAEIAASQPVRRSVPPERQVRRNGHGRSHAAPSGRRLRIKDREIAELVSAAQQSGFEPDVSGPHIKLRKGSETIVLPSTPSDHRAAKNGRSKLRRAGVAV
jgi:hypothetical protein